MTARNIANEERARCMLRLQAKALRLRPYVVEGTA